MLNTGRRSAGPVVCWRGAGERLRGMDQVPALGEASAVLAGQAIIQFATQLDDGTPCAMKFFADISAFHTEVALYDACGHTSILQAPQPPTRGSHVAPAVSNPDTGKFLPRAVAIMSKQDPELEGMAAVTDPTNAPRHVQRLPPCIVMEKGESLHDWSERAEPDFFMALAVPPRPRTHVLSPLSCIRASETRRGCPGGQAGTEAKEGRHVHERSG